MMIDRPLEFYEAIHANNNIVSVLFIIMLSLLVFPVVVSADAPWSSGTGTYAGYSWTSGTGTYAGAPWSGK